MTQTQEILLAIIIICPIFVVLFYLSAFLIQHIFFRAPVDLEDVIFSKDKSKSFTMADEGNEKNIVPIEEALVVTDKKNSRRLLLNVIKGEVNNSLSSIAMALESGDSETSHYAASILSKAFNDFRKNVRLMDAEIKSETDNQGELSIALIEYMNKMLIQRVFTNVEQEHFVKLMADTGEFVISLNKMDEASPMLDAMHISAITERLIEINANEEALLWSERAIEAFPEDIEAYRCRLHCLYKLSKKQQFLDTIEGLKKSGIALDKELMEMIRIFG